MFNNCSMVEYLKRPIACDTAALVRGVRRCVGTLPPAESGAMLAAVLSAAKNDAELRDLAKVLRAEAKRHNSATAAAAFAEGGGAAAAIAAVESSYDYFDDANDPESPEPIKAAADSLAALADLAAAGGAAHAAVIAAGTAGTVTKVLRDLANYGKIYASLYIQACRLAGNLSFGGAHYFGNSACYFANGLAPNPDDATAFRWAAHAIWNACTHSERARRAIHGHSVPDGVKVVRVVESLVKGASRFPGTPRAYGLRALAYLFLGSEARRQSALREGVALVLMDATRDEPGTAAAALLCVSSVVGPCGTAHLARWSGVADRADGLANITGKLAAVALDGGGDASAVSAGVIAVARGARDPRSFRAAVMPLLRDAIESATRPRARKALGAALHALQPRRHLYNVGAEAEAAGRAVPKNMQILRKDLAQLPWVLARPGDVVVAPPLSESLAGRLEAAGVARDTLPSFGDASLGQLALPDDVLRTVLGYLVDAPWAVADERLRRSHVTRYRNDVVVCASLDEVAAAARANWPNIGDAEGTILKAEYSSSGLGARTVARELTEQDEAWARNRLKADGVLTAEPRYDLEAEFTLEWYDGFFCGVSRPIVEAPGRWQGQNLGAADDLAPDIGEAVFGRRRWLESVMVPKDVPGTCGSATCGVDMGLVRFPGGTRAVVLECNARTTMSHIALAAKRRVPNASRFLVLPKRDVAPHHLPLTDGEHFVAVLELGDDSGPFPFVDDPDEGLWR
jgi:hypothetical protein